MSKIAFIGIGVMGQYMATNLAKSNKFSEVAIWNRTQNDKLNLPIESGCKNYLNLSEVLKNSEIICTCLTDYQAINSIFFEDKNLISLIKKGATIIDFSTISPNEAISFHENFIQNEINFIDVPVTGGDIGAKNGTLTLIVGEKEENCKPYIPVFESVGKKIVYTGKIGNGQKVKAVNQLLCAINMIAVSEAMSLCDIAEIDKNTMLEVCTSGAAGSWALANLGQAIVNENFQPAFMIKHLLKDIKFVEELTNYNSNFTGLLQAKEKLEKADPDLGTQAMYLVYKELLK